MYSIAVKVDDVEKRRRNAGASHIIMGLFIAIKATDYFRYLEYLNFFSVVPFYLISFVSILFALFYRRRIYMMAKLNSRVRLLQIFAFLALCFVFARMNQTFDLVFCIIFGLVSMLLYFSERKIFEETCIRLDEEGIRIPGMYKEHFVSWDEISEVVIREDFITLFHVKKKYLQYQVMQDLSTLEIAKMNAFCKEFAKGTVEENES